MIRLSLAPNIVFVLAGILALLTLATSALGAAIAADRVLGLNAEWMRSPILPELRRRIRAWWIMAAAFGASLAIGRIASLAFLALVSFLVLREYLSVAPFRPEERNYLFAAYAAIPLQYGWIAAGGSNAAAIVPLVALAAVSAIAAVRGAAADFLRSSALVLWGVVVAIVALAHLALLVTLPASLANIAGGPGLLLFVVTVCQSGDVAQYLVGKSMGRRRAVPAISPNKTVAGFAGGLAATALVAAGLGPYLTPMGRPEALAIGLMLGVLGSLGGLMVSAMKRDLGIKDMGRLLPGHGGALDRVDSLVFAAPFFYYYIFFAH